MGSTGEALGRHNKLDFLQEGSSSQEDLANASPPTVGPQVNVDILHRSATGYDELTSQAAPSLATVREDPLPSGQLVTVGDCGDDEVDRV